MLETIKKLANTLKEQIKEIANITIYVVKNAILNTYKMIKALSQVFAEILSKKETAIPFLVILGGTIILTIAWFVFLSVAPTWLLVILACICFSLTVATA